MSDEVATAILEAEQRRCAAMLANDAAALDALLDPRVSFSHATGQVDDKAAYMTKMGEGRIDYLSIHWSEDRVIPLGRDAALLTGRMTLRVMVEGVEKQLDNRVLAGWSLTEGGWRLVAFQPTPLKA